MKVPWILISSLILVESKAFSTPSNSTFQAEVEQELVVNDTSTAEQILDFLIENNSAVNFALKRGNNKRKQQQTESDGKRDSNNMSLSIDNQINNRISSYLTKKNDKLKNVTALELKVNETLDTYIAKGKESSSQITIVKATPTLPPFFSNAYNRVVHLLDSKNTTTGEPLSNLPPKPPKKPTEEEILAEVHTEKLDTPIKASILEETINEIGSQLIEKSSTAKSDKISTTTIQPSTTIGNDDPLPVTTPATKAKLTTTTIRNTIQKLGDRVGGLLERLGINKANTGKPMGANNRNTYQFETSTTNPPSRKSPSIATTSKLPEISSFANIILPDNVIKEETVESINSVQSFLQQFGVTLSTFVDTTTKSISEELNDDANMRLPTTFRTTRRPYPWTTNRYRPSNDAQTIPTYFEEMETTTRKIFPTSFWRKTTTTTKPTIRYPTRMPSINKITSELSDASLIDTENKNTTLVKISILNAGCQAEKSVLMLFNKNQKVLISIDTTDDYKVNEPSSEQNNLKPSKKPNGVELEIKDESSEVVDGTRLEDNNEESAGENVKETTKAPKVTSTTKRSRSTRTTQTTTRRVRTNRPRKTRRPQLVEYDENIVSTTTKKQKRRRTKGNKRKGNRNKNRKGSVSAIPVANATVEPQILSSNSTI